MNRTAKYFILALSFCSAAHGASLLRPASFPDTAHDTTFSQRVVLLAAGYEPWESEYDDTGRCISGCAYPGITIAEDLARLTENTARAYASLPPADWSQPSVSYAVPTCSPRQNAISPLQTVPFGEPLVGQPRVTSAYGERIHPVTGNRSVHKGIDFAASQGTTVFSPAAGTVASVWTDASCGNGVRIAHADGFETVYCHLDTALVQDGEYVQAGCPVAYSGNTGRSTGPHLHYAIKYNGEYIDPTGMVGRI